MSRANWNRNRFLLPAVALLLWAIGCSDRPPRAPGGEKKPEVHQSAFGGDARGIRCKLETNTLYWSRGDPLKVRTFLENLGEETAELRVFGAVQIGPFYCPIDLAANGAPARDAKGSRLTIPGKSVVVSSYDLSRLPWAEAASPDWPRRNIQDVVRFGDYDMFLLVRNLSAPDAEPVVLKSGTLPVKIVSR
jgi:hypothetical protein